MITAELNHNPYILETIVRFNGQPPRINCQIEKYEKLPLSRWADEVPGIFYDEMNGFDFDLFFSGTESDLKKVQEAFRKRGIDEKQVRIVFKNELDSIETKYKQTNQLLRWFEENPNRRLNLQKFSLNHPELYDDVYPVKLILANGNPEPEGRLTFEVISNIQDLAGTDLTEIPIVFCLDKRNIKGFRKILEQIAERNDVVQEQIFFHLDPALDCKSTVRVLHDLGMEKVQLVQSYTDPAILRYVQEYPMSSYIRNALEILENTLMTIGTGLESDNRKSIIANREVHNQISEIESRIDGYQDGYQILFHRDRYQMPSSLQEPMEKFRYAIERWKARKSKITGDYEIQEAEKELEELLKQAVSTFNTQLNEIVLQEEKSLEEILHSIVENAGCQTEMLPASFPVCQSMLTSPNIRQELFSLCQMEVQEGRFGFFRMNSDSGSEPARTSVIVLEKWRTKALESILPSMEQAMQEAFICLESNYNAIAQEYCQILEKLTEASRLAKASIESQLSDEEKILQDDNNWFILFKQQLLGIERD